jgi:hypothetical protein
MASFTDNTQALSTFNPYEQQPIDAMVKVCRSNNNTMKVPKNTRKY